MLQPTTENGSKSRGNKWLRPLMNFRLITYVIVCYKKETAVNRRVVRRESYLRSQLNQQVTGIRSVPVLRSRLNASPSRSIHHFCHWLRQVNNSGIFFIGQGIQRTRQMGSRKLNVRLTFRSRRLPAVYVGCKLEIRSAY